MLSDRNLHPAPRMGPDTFRTTAILAVIAAALAGCLPACGAPASDDPRWRETSAAPSSDGADQPASTTNSLGDPFVVIADALEGSTLLAANTSPSGASVVQAWALLRSDACQVELDALNLAFHQDGTEPAWLSTAGPTHGVVLDASPRDVVIRFHAQVRVTHGRGSSPGS
ncbi:MAG: hypothetical protein ACOC1F_11235, partial [Myxococcota bacterium]